MSIARGRILRAQEGNFVPLQVPARPPAPVGRRAPREIVEAEQRAREIVKSAEHRARALVEEAFREVAGVKLRAQSEGRAEAAASLAARAVELKALEVRAEDRALDRIVEVATVLAERLLGEALRAEPQRVQALARQALSETRGARSVKIHAHPDDVAELRQAVGDLGLEGHSVTLIADVGRARGHLLLETDIGMLDAELGPQLQRLGKKIREALSA